MRRGSEIPDLKALSRGFIFTEEDSEMRRVDREPQKVDDDQTRARENRISQQIQQIGIQR